MDNLKITLKNIRRYTGKDPDLIVMNYPTFDENQGKQTFYGVPVILNMRSRQDAVFYSFDNQQVLKPIIGV